MLDPLPTKRPTLEELYEELTKMLKNVDSGVHTTLENLLAYYDEIAKSYKETLSDVDVLLQLVKLIEIPGTLNLIRQLVEDWKGRIEGLSLPKSPKEVYDYVKVSCTLGRVLAYIDKEKYREEIIKYGLNCTDLVSRWKNEIKVEHTPFKGITDYEACCHIVSYGLDLLREVLTEQEIETIIRGKYDEYMKSLYWFDRALIAHDRADYSQALQYIEEALKHEPKNVTLLFFKALWKYHWAKVMSIKVRGLLKEALKELEEVCRLEPTWKEPKETLEKVKAEGLREEL
jgi:tetratricopeptide (TPR) repeat protein